MALEEGMRSHIFTAIIVLAINAPHSGVSEEIGVLPWQGEWVSTDGQRNSVLSIKQCGENGQCEVGAFQLSSDSPSCYRRGVTDAAVKSANSVSATIYPVNDYYQACRLVIESDGRVLALKNTGLCSIGSCSLVKDGEKISFNLISKENFSEIPGGYGGECYRSDSKSIRALCTDGELRREVERALDIPFVAKDRSWFVDSSVFKICDGDGDVKSCLRKEYNKKIEVLEEEARKLAIPYGEAGDVNDARQLIDKMAGVYKEKVKRDDLVGGGQYEAENIFEFVKVSEFAAYSKMHLEFTNGHVCNIAGIFEYKRVGGFVFRDADREYPCLLTAKVDGEVIEFDDPEGRCRNKFCGARGSFGEIFSAWQKRKIKYMNVILNSDDYKRAVAEYEKRHNVTVTSGRRQ